ncbi:MAG: hypothetical protein GC151_10295 [Betaproteobacteria bacterium]|nr:hypothetical protein [Betaproteobacteria bacterium]
MFARIAAARARLVLERPFVGTLALHLEPAAADPAWCDTVATDGRRFWFNPSFVAALPADALGFWLAHVTMHCALGHFTRRGHRLVRRWDIACDHAVNLLLRADGFTLPAGALADPAFDGLPAEAIYPLIPEDTADRPGDRHAGGGGGLSGYLGEASRPPSRGEVVVGEPRPGTPDDGAGHEADPDAWDDAGHERRRSSPTEPRDTLVGAAADLRANEEAWRARLAAAAQAAREAGRLGRSWDRVLESLIAPSLPWRALLARFIASAAREDYTFQRPPRRDAAAILPRLARGSMRIVAALDTSGSITPAELGEFAAELDALKAQVRAELTIHACDERLDDSGPWHFGPWDPVVLPGHLSGGGGTRFTPLFEWVETEHVVPDVLVYFTDAFGEFPPEPPPYPVLWLVKGRGEVPFGERIQLN